MGNEGRERDQFPLAKLSCGWEGIVEQRGEGGRQGHSGREWHQNKLRWIYHCSTGKILNYRQPDCVEKCFKIDKTGRTR